MPELDAAEAELCPKWIRRDGNLWWIINGLRFQPSLMVDDRKHRTFVRRSFEDLPSGAIRDAFREYYRDWFDADTPAQQQTEVPSKPHTSPIEGPSEDHRSKVEGSCVAGSINYKPSNRPTGESLRAAAPVRALLTERLADPRATAAVNVFLDRVPPTDDPEFWAAEVNAWLDGLNTPGGKAASSTHIAGALEEFNRKVAPTYDPPYVRGFLRRTMTGAVSRSPPRRSSSPSSNPGAQQVANILGGSRVD